MIHHMLDPWIYASTLVSLLYLVVVQDSYVNQVSWTVTWKVSLVYLCT